LDLTIRQSISKLTRRTWGPARYTSELTEYLEFPLRGTLVAELLPFRATA